MRISGILAPNVGVNGAPTSESFYRALIEQTSDLVSVIDAGAVIHYVSPSHRRILGYEPAELLGRNAFDFIRADDLDWLSERFRRAAATAGQTASGPYHFRHADGSWRTLDSVGTNLLADPSVAGFVINARDVTDLEVRVRERTAELVSVNQTLRAEIAERERAEASLRRSEERYRLLVENINEVIFTVDPNGLLTYVSPAIERATGGYCPAEVVGHSFFEFVHPDDVPALAKSFQRLLAGQPEPSEYRVFGKDGEVHWLRTQSQAIVEAGRVIAVQGVLTDITARRRAEAEARQRRAELAHMQRLTTAGEMTAEIAHQINQPLAAIVNFAAGMATRLRDGKIQPDAMREVAERIASEARRAAEVISRLRAFLRKGESLLRDCNLNEVVARVCELLEEDFRREAVDAHLCLEPGLPTLRLDAILIEQVILNLLRNALDALAESDGVRRVEVATVLADQEARVTVKDTGTGLPRGREMSIFEAFFTTKSGGLGLGLSVSRSIITASGGRLWAERNPDRGTTVGFALPLSGQEPA